MFAETLDGDVKFKQEDGKGVPHITDVNKTLHYIISNAELYNDND